MELISASQERNLRQGTASDPNLGELSAREAGENCWKDAGAEEEAQG